MSTRQHHRPASRSGWVLGAIASVFAVIGMAAVWAGVGLLLRTPASWMGLIVAADAVLLLYLAGIPAGPARGAVALLTTALTIPAAAFLLASGRIGALMGMPPSEAVWRMSLELAWLYSGDTLGSFDLLLFVLACIAAWWLGHRGLRPAQRSSRV